MIGIRHSTFDSGSVTIRRVVADGLMKHKHWLQGGLIAFIGFMLSPLSWWNDAFVNFPLAIGFGWLVALAYKPAFEPAVVFGYWLTNVLGLVLMHKGAQRALRPEQRQSYTRKSLLRDVAISLAYTLVIVLLIKLNVLQPVQDYLKT